jgi:Sulfotransferase family
VSTTSLTGTDVPSGTRAVQPRILFLGGLGRSGTTILERVLGELSDACSVGELVHLWQRAVLDDETCGCGEPFSRCPFWTEVGRRAFGGWDRAHAMRMVRLRDRVDRTRHVLLAAVPAVRRREREEYVGAFGRLYGAIAETSGCSVVIDSSKHSSLAFCLRTAKGIDLRVLHVVRDPRGVAYSWTKEVLRPEASGRDLMTRYSPFRASVLWVGHNVVLSMLRRLGTGSQRLRYEDFVADPEGSVASVARFAGLPDGNGVADFLSGHTVELGRAHTVAGNPVRFRTGPMTLRRDDAWRERLPRRRRVLVTLLTFPLVVRYGYLRAGRSAR